MANEKGGDAEAGVQVSRAKKSRQGFKLQLNNAKAKVDGMVKGTEAKDINVLKRVKEKMKFYLDEVRQLDKAILDSITVETELEAEIVAQTTFIDSVLDHMLLIEQAIEDARAPSTTSSAGRDSSQSSGPGPSAQSTKIKLPKIEIPTFSGDMLQWQSFWDIFNATVHADQGLSKIQKLSYLLGYLDGEAFDMVRGFQLTEVNYETVVDVLHERYGDKQRTKFGHCEALVAVRPASLNSKDLVRMFYECERHIRSLIALGLTESEFYVPIILDKLPPQVKREIWSTNGTDELTMENLRKYLKAYITAREVSETKFRDESSASSDRKKASHEAKSSPSPAAKGSASMLVANSQAKGGKPQQKQRKCVFCGLIGHFSDQCRKYPDADARTECLAQRKACYNCLQTGHTKIECRAGNRECTYCGRKGHDRSLCYKQFGVGRSSGSSKQNAGKQDNVVMNPEAPSFVPKNDKSVSEITATATESESVHTEVAFLPTAVTTFSNEGGNLHEKGRVLMDTASSRSYITEELCRKLKLPVIEEAFVSVGRFASTKRITTKTKRVRFKVQCQDKSEVSVVANVTSAISTPICRVPIDPERFPVVKDLQLGEPLNDKPDELPLNVLIGSDYYYQFVTTNSVIHCQDGPVFVKSKLGYLTAGTMSANTSEPENTVIMLLTETGAGKNHDSYDSFGIERFWQVEDVGVKAKVAKTDIDDEQALASFYRSIKFEDGRYWVKWPWKSENPDLADNRKLAYARFMSTVERLKKDPKLLGQYNDIIQKQLECGVVEEAPQVPEGLVYYVPHREVLTPGKTTTKIRIVFDASSKARKTDLCLNDCMHRGLVVLDDLCGMLMRFRLHKIAIVADIEKAFLQVGLQRTERDVARFFWLRDVSKPATSDNVVTLRFTRVFFGAIGSPMLLGATLDAHAQKTAENASDPLVRDMAQQFRTNRYTDNVIFGAESVEKAIRYCQEAKAMCSETSMNLREYFTNAECVRDAIPVADRGQTMVPKILGVNWNLEKDKLSCPGIKNDVSVLVGTACTKRSVVREVAQVFDPCGWWSPVSVMGKMFVQELWRKSVAWDESIGAELSRNWEKVRTELRNIPNGEIPRYIGDSAAENHLHVFCDASEKAAAAAVYLRKVGVNGVTCDLVFAKTRIAPLKQPLTIPCLELVAFELGTNLLEFVEEELRVKIRSRTVWSDSMVVLQWLRKARLSSKFVQNRVEAILTHKNVSFRYVSTRENPADIPSRGTTVSALSENSMWWHGPDWLCKPEDAWPKDPIEGDALPVAIGPQLNTLATSDGVVSVVKPVLKRDRYSELSKLLRVTAYVFRACRNFRARRGTRENGSLHLSEIASARLYWERTVQKQAFPELNSASWRTWLRKSKLHQLNVFKDEQGVFRCRGRLEFASVQASARNPVLLPKNDPFTVMVIRWAHVANCHAGVSQTLAETRQRYWIVHGRSQVKWVIRSCNRCRRVDGGSYRIPPPPNLPDIRVSERAAFAYTGLDYLGPLVIRVEKGAAGTQKVWICLFTCALTRAVHLEVVENQTADEFHLALRRFFALYGTPEVIVSDNAAQFRAVEDAMVRMGRTSKPMAEVATDFNVQWRKIPEMAPWMGGFYERLVGVVKKHLKKTLDGVCVRMSELRTVVSEISYVINSRPLLYVEDDMSAYTLCPRDFLGKACRSGFPTFDETPEAVPQSTVGNVVANWKRVQSVSSRFWDMWRKSYLTSLRERHANATQRNTSSLVPTVGSVVQIKDKMPRAQWKLGKVEKLNAGGDQRVRSVVLRLASGRTITRPIKLLYPLEMGSSGAAEPFNPTYTRGANQPDMRRDDAGDGDEEFEGFSQASVQAAQDRLDVFGEEGDSDEVGSVRGGH